MQNFLIKIVFYVVSLLILVACVPSADSRAIEFTSNAFNGVHMKSEDWLTTDGEKSGLLNHFGGLETLIRQSKSEADRQGGVKKITVINTEKTGEKVFVEVEVTFQNGEKTSNRDAWRKENGQWKMTP